MDFIIPFVILIITYLILIVKYLPRRSNNIGLAVFIVIVSFFHFDVPGSRLQLPLFALVLLPRIKRLPQIVPFYLYIIFLVYCAINTLFLSTSYHFGLLMIIKLFVPFMFLIYGYNVFKSGNEFYYFAKRVAAIIPFFAIVSSYPISLLREYTSAFMKAWSAGDVEIFAVLLSIPLSLFLIENQKKHFVTAVCCMLPPLSMIRRTVLGSQFSVATIFAMIKKGVKSIIPIGLMVAVALVAVLNIAPIRERVFGGDKGDVSGVSNKELLSSTDYIGTSGRSSMWAYMTAEFYVGNEVFGCGLGTMKSYMRRADNSGEDASFEMLHNDHLHLLIETGIVGIFLFSLFVVWLIIYLISNMKRTKDKRAPRFACNFCALSSFVVIIFCMFFSNILSQVWEIIVCFMFIGMAMKANELSRKTISVNRVI